MVQMRRTGSKRASHSWALKIEQSDSRLKTQGSKLGLEYARELAQDDLDRSRGALSQRYGEPLPERLTPAELAERDRTSPVIVRRLIKKARLELFGDVGPRQIHNKLKREREIQRRRQALTAYERAGHRIDQLAEDLAPLVRLCTCGCLRALPTSARSNRKYYDKTNCKMRLNRGGGEARASAK